MHKATCSDCGAECEVPFKPTEGKPVRCQDCFKKNRPQRSFGGNRSGGGGGSRGGFGGSRGGFDRRPREMHKATCAECKQECEVPFKPTEDRDVFCKDCFTKRKGTESGSEEKSEEEF